MPTQTLEECVAFLEARVKEIKQAEEPNKLDDTIPWWKRIVGIHADSAGFEESVKFGQEWREADYPNDERIN
ncbi:MAG: hypothetical protein ACRYFS_03190 [Janthinobacterium lividum]